MPEPIYGFHHICLEKNGLDVFVDQLQTLKTSGLYDASSTIFCSIVGKQTDIVLPKKYKVVYESRQSNMYERPILQYMQKHASTMHGKYWYIHTKGISHVGTAKEQNVRDWRKYMEYFIVQKWATCVKDLDLYDIAGVNHEKDPFYHFSGNFWWANSSYIETIQTELNYEDYYETEYWLCSGKPSLIGISYHSSKVQHYEHRYTPEKYVNVEQIPVIFSPGLSEPMFANGYESSQLQFESLPKRIIRKPVVSNN